MSHHVVRVRAPSRLHFGMLSFGDPTVRQFGGVGIMIESPGVDLTISPSHRLSVRGVHSQRVRDVVKRWSQHHGTGHDAACRIHVTDAPRQHIGLGAGTQLELSVAAGLNLLTGLPEASAEQLAATVGRGKRSAVGTHGFLHGGLVAELGKRREDRLAPLARRLALPDPWRVVLLIPTGQVGLSGVAEQQAFDALPPVPRDTTERLTRELVDHMLPAAEDEQFEQFAESVYRFGVEAGSCFAQRQAGAFASPRLVETVGAIRGMGIKGVGQSSWGPTLFVLQPNEQRAADFVQRAPSCFDTTGLQLLVTRVNNHGAICTRRLLREPV